jgi:hypothetical protein
MNAVQIVRAVPIREKRRGKDVVGRDGGYTAKAGDAVSIVLTVNPDAGRRIRSLQVVIGTCSSAIRSQDPQTKWEGTR